MRFSKRSVSAVLVAVIVVMYAATSFARQPFPAQIQQALMAIGLWPYGIYSDGQVPAWNDSSNKFIPSTGTSGAITPTSVGLPATTCAAPGVYLTTAPTTGIAFTATPSVILCVNGTAIVTTTASAVTSTVPGRFTAVGVGVTPPAAGVIQANSDVLSGNDVRLAGGRYVYAVGGTQIQFFSNGSIKFLTANGTSGILSEQFTDNPTCATNCGTSPTLTGVDSSFTLTMGGSGSPASGFIVTFNGTWAAAPQCTVSMGLGGMVAGKLPLTVVTTATTATVVTNGTAPANSDVYHFRCSLGQ